MRETHHVVLTGNALSDLEGIAAYIRQSSPQNAATVAETIIKSIDSLGLMPERFKQVGRSRKKKSAIRAMVVRPFVIYYRIDEQPKAVYILNVFHGARRQPRQFD